MKIAAGVFARHGYGVALDVVAKESEVGRATLYRNFADRRSLAIAVLENHINEVAELASKLGDDAHGFIRLLRKMCEGRTDHGALAAAVLAKDGAEGRQAITILRARMERICAGPLVQTKRSGLVSDSFELKDIHMLTMMLAAGSAEGQGLGEGPDLDHTINLILDGIRPR